MKTPLTAICAALVLIVAALPLTSLAQGVEAARVQETVATARFKKAAPYRVGVAAGYLSNSWVVFCLQHIRDRKSTRLNSSHGSISYAVFCLKKKKNTSKNYIRTSQ